MTDSLFYNQTSSPQERHRRPRPRLHSPLRRRPHARPDFARRFAVDSFHTAKHFGCMERVDSLATTTLPTSHDRASRSSLSLSHDKPMTSTRQRKPWFAATSCHARSTTGGDPAPATPVTHPAPSNHHHQTHRLLVATPVSQRMASMDTQSTEEHLRTNALVTTKTSTLCSKVNANPRTHLRTRRSSQEHPTWRERACESEEGFVAGRGEGGG